MDAKELIEIAEEKGYITKSYTYYGYLISADNENLRTKIVEYLEDDDDLVMLQWTEYNILIFSCDIFKEFCDLNYKDVNSEIKTSLSMELYESSFDGQMEKAITKFNAKNYDLLIEDGYVIDRKMKEERQQNDAEKQDEEERRQQEIDDFVDSLE